MKTLHKQIGASIGGIIFNVGILIFLGFMASKIAVTYLDNNSVRSTLNDLDDIPYLTKKSEREITQILVDRFRLNNVPVGQKMIVVDKKSDRVIVEINYERRVPLISNIDAVVSFENYYEAVRR